MNAEKLIATAKKIDVLAAKHAARSNAWRQLVQDAKAGPDRDEIERRRQELDAGRVIDYGTAIAEPGAALHRP